MRLLEANGLGERAAQAIEGNGWVGGSLEQLEKKDDPCEGAVPREHSHFFTEFGTFGSLDWRGEQVDENTYELVDSRTFTIGDGDAMFHFEIQGDTITFEPVLPDTCSGFDCVWMLAVASRLHLAARELMTAVSLVAIVLVLAVCGGSPTEIDDDPSQTSVNAPRARRRSTERG